MAHSPELQRFYASARWRGLREMLIVERHGLCDRCGKDFSDDTSKLIAHHKEHLTDETLKDPAVAVDPQNIEVLCPKCHAHYHPERGFVKKQKQVFIVYGSPLSGKTTYVRQNMEVGDLVVDLRKTGGFYIENNDATFKGDKLVFGVVGLIVYRLCGIVGKIALHTVDDLLPDLFGGGHGKREGLHVAVIGDGDGLVSPFLGKLYHVGRDVDGVHR